MRNFLFVLSLPALTLGLPSPVFASATPIENAKQPLANLTDPRLAEERLVLETNLGNLVIVLYPKIAPRHVAQVLRLVRLNVYDGIHIYRVEKNFVAQIANEFDRETPLQPDQQAAITKIPGEFSALHHERGTLSMARFDDPGSAEVSFSILLGPAPHLDQKFTIFGRLEQGFDVLERIENSSVGATFAPDSKITVLHAEAVLERDLPRYLMEHAHSAPDLQAGRVKTLTESIVLAVAFLALITALSFGVLLVPSQHQRVRTALAHLILLVSGVGILTLVSPMIHDQYKILGAVLFFGLVAIFKVLGKFDAPE
jgi:cyclophilin family peptidyl-prolyl cis-trans isomerase